VELIDTLHIYRTYTTIKEFVLTSADRVRAQHLARFDSSSLEVGHFAIFFSLNSIQSISSSREERVDNGLRIFRKTAVSQNLWKDI